MSREAEVLDLLRQTGALQDGHFLLASGLHSPTYVEKFRVLEWPSQTEKLCRMIADRFRDAGVQVVAGPTTGGIIIAYEVARHLGVRSIFAEREEAPLQPVEGASRQAEERRFRRGFALAPGERVLVVDDIMTTGGSLRAVLAELARHGGQAVAVAVLVERVARPVDFGVPLVSLTKLEIPAYDPASCPLCAQGLPLVKPGTSRPQAAP
jgi:orotate phosphoribosyltransferase